jgi:superoxide dismutase, Fe-Mn family
MANFTLPPLPYAYDALEPHIDAKTMEIHYTKHHQAYTDGLNKALGTLGQEFQNKDVVDILKNIDGVPDSARGAVNFHGGGYNNHALFWNNMKKGGGGEPSGELGNSIKKAFGNFADFKDKFSKDTIAIQGSGWGWLTMNKNSNSIQFTTMPNQTSLWTKWKTDKLVPLLGLDVWEHAYYLKYQNKRADYVAAWWNVVNWDEVAKRFNGA